MEDLNKSHPFVVDDIVPDKVINFIGISDNYGNIEIKDNIIYVYSYDNYVVAEMDERGFIVGKNVYVTNLSIIIPNGYKAIFCPTYSNAIKLLIDREVIIYKTRNFISKDRPIGKIILVKDETINFKIIK